MKIIFDRIAELAEKYNIPLNDMTKIVEKYIIKTWEQYHGEGYKLKFKSTPHKTSLNRLLVVVEENKFDDPEWFKQHISLEEAQANSKEKISVGDIIEEPVPFNLSNQVIFQGSQGMRQEIKEYTKNKEYEIFFPYVGNIFTCNVISFVPRHGAIVMINEFGFPKYHGFLSSDFIAKSEAFSPGLSILCRLNEVKKDLQFHQLLFERTSSEFLSGLIAKIIPEMNQKVSIVRIARDPGVRSKVVVKALEPAINVLGLCIGHKSNRLKTIREAISNEKVDFILYDSDLKTQIHNCFKDIKINEINIGEEIEVVVDEKDFGKALGSNGQNARLVGSILKQKIKIVSKEKLDETKDSKDFFDENSTTKS